MSGVAFGVAGIEAECINTYTDDVPFFAKERSRFSTEAGIVCDACLVRVRERFGVADSVSPLHTL